MTRKTARNAKPRETGGKGWVLAQADAVEVVKTDVKVTRREVVTRLV
jgi:hypothetical protein